MSFDKRVRILFAIMAIFAMLISGCGGDTAPADTVVQDQPAQTDTTADNTATETEAAAEEPVEELDLVAEADAFLSSIPDGYYTIALDDVKALIDTGSVLLLDVRTAGEYEEGHIPGAVNVPLRELAQNLDKVPTDRTVVVYCASGYRAALANAQLHTLGFDNVRAYTAGYAGWTDAAEDVSTEVVAAESFGDPDVNPQLVAAADAWLSAIPEGFYAIGAVDKVQEIMDAGNVMLLDVRTPAEYAEGYIPGAVNVPLRELAQNLDQIPTDQQVIVYCASGYRAALATSMLHLLGYDNVRGFPPSYAGWVDAGAPIEGGMAGPETGEDAVVVAVDSFLSNIPDGYYMVKDAEQVTTMVDSANAFLLDVRTAAEYEEGHLPGAVNVPLRELAQNLEYVPTDRSVVVYCQSGYRAALAGTQLLILGYDNVRIYSPSYVGWVEAGGEVSTEMAAAESVGAPDVAPGLVAASNEFLSSIPDGYYSIGSVDQLKQIMDAGTVTLVDVRQADEYAEGYIPGAINVPLRELAENLDQIPTDQPVVLYCASGYRCTLGMSALQTLGYTNARAFPPSMQGWTDAGEPIEN